MISTAKWTGAIPWGRPVPLGLLSVEPSLLVDGVHYMCDSQPYSDVHWASVDSSGERATTPLEYPRLLGPNIPDQF